jgi:hypothetical protein
MFFTLHLQSDNSIKLEKIIEVSTFILHLIQIIHISYFPYKYCGTLLLLVDLSYLYSLIIGVNYVVVV